MSALQNLVKTFAIAACLILLAFNSVLAQAKEGILLVAFGTSVPEAKVAMDNIENEYRKAYPDTPLVWAYTSQIIRKKLARQGIHVGSIGQGLSQLAKAGVKIARVQSLHMMAGEEFAALARSLLINIQNHPGRFEAVYLGRPLLESMRDANDASAAILAEMATKKQGDAALILMGHGQDQGRADLVFEGTRSIFNQHDPNIFLATVEGSRGFDDLLSDLRKTNVKKVWLMPLMVVAGDHARNDLSGSDPDSWASRLRTQGYEVQTNLKGLGELTDIAQIFIRHTRDSRDNLVLEPQKP